MRKKTTMYIEEDLLRAIKVAAVREDKPEYLLVEEALRDRLDFSLLERIRARAGLDEDAAMKLAVEELHATRAERRARPSE